MFFGNDKQKRIKLSVLENQILDLQGKRREMEIELANKALDLKNTSRTQEMKLEELAHSHKLTLQGQKIEMERVGRGFKEDMKKLEDRAEEDKARLVADLEKKAEMEMLETRTMMKLEAEQKIAKALLEAEKKVILKDAQISDLKKEHAEHLATLKSDLSKEHYDNLKENLEKFHSEGNTTTKFMQELSLEMLKNRPKHDVSVGVECLEAGKDG